MSINNRYDFVYLFDVKDGNPNGDPDAGNMPRVDPETGHGLITDVCLKRKVRNYLEMDKEGKEGYRIYVQEKAILNERHKEAYKHFDLAHVSKKLPADVKKAKQITGWMCANFYDIRSFGAVMSTEVNAGQVRGPIQLTFSRSADPIFAQEHSITRMAVTKKADLEKERTMGRKATVPYGLYRCHGFISAHLAAQTGFSENDLKLFLQALENMFDHDRSAARGEMTARGLYIFKHDNKLGNTHANKLFDRVTVKTLSEKKPPRSFGDYQIAVNESEIPAGISLIKRIH